MIVRIRDDRNPVCTTAIAPASSTSPSIHFFHAVQTSSRQAVRLTSATTSSPS
jgi:hypothetical protein